MIKNSHLATQDIKQHPLIILDFGSQYTQLIARRVREIGVYCEIYPFDIDANIVAPKKPCGFILSGGPASATKDDTPQAPEWVFQANLPILGICYGMQTMAVQLGGKVVTSDRREFGYAELRVHGHTKLFKDIYDRKTIEGCDILDVWMSHGDQVTVLPPNFQIICETSNAPIAGMVNEKRQWYGLQFHPEVTHTSQGTRILERFLFDICHAQHDWTPANIIEQTLMKVRKTVGSERVLLALSGGVDSSVVAALLHKAIGEQLVCVFVDTGLLRCNETEQILTVFSKHLGIEVIAVDASEQFFQGLKEVTCPETKRKIIGKIFIEVFEKEALRLNNIPWLAQGTIYPDVIESATTSASETIKSHHNVGGIPINIQLKLLEPLRELFKDEVRKIGLELGLPAAMVYRHPFPGPGLAVRILGEVKKEFVNILRKADLIFVDALHKAGLYDQVSQAFAVFLPIKSVGVMGDGRRYDYVICLRAVETIDFMTAQWAKLPWDFLDNVSTRIINEVPGISRVTYDISGKPPATIEWE